MKPLASLKGERRLKHTRPFVRVSGTGAVSRLWHNGQCPMADVGFGADNGRKSDVDPCPKIATNGLMRCSKIGAVSENRLSGMQLLQQRLGLLQTERVEALGEPAIN
jgi:hypothetical protein